MTIGAISAEGARRVFADVAGPDLESEGFSPGRGMVWARAVSEDLVHIIALTRLKWEFKLRWGASLPFVPHAWAPGLRWHRSIDDSRFDVFEWPDEASPHAPSRGEPGSFVHWARSALHSIVGIRGTPNSVAECLGEDVFRKEMSALWKPLRERTKAWLERARTLGDVLERAREQIAEDESRGWNAGPGVSVARAFLLARLGRRDEGLRALELVQPVGVHVGESRLDEASLRRLRAALERAARR